ncbi:uncharacterized protein LOC110095376 [Dendrobium catenatum]|uniref:Wound-responsive family protein n=1 Tax=Dendrobium catenatum TaxID=906689 RepID=A0A2I0WKE5_9ASPA|nr:uncharacterized protein LOC110095376 [Dendrobium catenatum]PKU76134.1 hypothetical protein MA16_Dca025643 [Dendrobium catenatum]
MASASKASLAVATSMSAVEALKDQLGLCRWNYTISNISRHAINPIARPSSQLRHVSSSAAAAVAVVQIDSKIPAAEEMRRRRRAEKAEKVRNLVCWGPN